MNRHYPPLRNRLVDMLGHVVGSPVLTGSVLRSITFFGIRSSASSLLSGRTLRAEEQNLLAKSFSFTVFVQSVNVQAMTLCLLSTFH
jgi:hypothetical protein